MGCFCRACNLKGTVFPSIFRVTTMSSLSSTFMVILQITQNCETLMEIGQCTGTGERASLAHFHISVCKPHNKTVKHHQQKKEGFIYFYFLLYYFTLLFFTKSNSCFIYSYNQRGLIYCKALLCWPCSLGHHQLKRTSQKMVQISGY